MRRSTLSLSAVLLSFLLLCGCGKKNSYDFETTFPSGNTAELHLEFSTSPPTAPTPIPTPLPTPSPTPIPADPSVSPAPIPGYETASPPTTEAGIDPGQTAAQQTPIQTLPPTAPPTVPPTPIPTVFYPNEVTIAKSPTSETVYAGGSALFIARATNATSINWILVSPDARTSYKIQDIPQYFEGVSVEGQGTENLRLSNIPIALSGWRVQCYFTGENGPKYTSGAYLTVLNSTPEPVYTAFPSIVNNSDTATRAAVESATISSAQQIYQTAVSYGYTVTDISNYVYANNMATFSMNFYYGAKTCIANFRTLYNAGTYPTTVYYYYNGQAKSEDLSGQGLDVLYSRLMSLISA